MKQFNRLSGISLFFLAVLSILGSIRYYSGTSLGSVITQEIIFFIALLGFTFIIQLIQKFYHSKQVINTTNVATVGLFSIVASSLIQILFGETIGVGYSGWSFYFSNLIVAFNLLFIGLLIYWLDKQKVESDFHRLKAINKERESAKFQLKSLEKQWQPHFLFNSLNSISALTTIDPEKAQEMVNLLAEFMRNSLKSKEDKMISFQEEIEHIKLYAAIEDVRFGERLNIVFNYSNECEDQKLPRLILQPILENAIKYGLYDSLNNVTINIDAQLQDGIFEVIISNPFDKSTNYGNKGVGFGIQSVKSKLLLLYGRNDLFEIKKEDSIFSVKLRFVQL